MVKEKYLRRGGISKKRKAGNSCIVCTLHTYIPVHTLQPIPLAFFFSPLAALPLIRGDEI